MAARVLVVGPIRGQIQKAFQKISKLHAKTDFAFALVVGDLFSADSAQDIESLLSGSIQIPLPTYFTLGDHGLPEKVQERLETSAEICPNLSYLGRKGTLKTTEGIQIVFLGGRLVQNEESLTQLIGKYDPLFLENEARVLQGANKAHILLTNQWPARIENGSHVPIPVGLDIKNSSTAVANLCATLKPRYHFSPLPCASWKREPFTWPLDYTENAEIQVTRFEALGGMDLKTSEWMSAFTLDPTKSITSEGAQRSAPFTVSSPRIKRKRNPDDAYSHQARRFDNTNAYFGGSGDRGKKRQKASFDPNDCFMCLGKQTFSEDMVISIAEESFLTSLRGPLPISTTFPQLQSSGNLMIIPMYHAADETSHGRRARSEIQTEYAEMSRYRHALQYMLCQKTNRELGAVCWEVNRTGIRHFHWQWVACPQILVEKGLVQAAFKIAAEKNEYDRFRSCNPDTLLEDRNSDFFRVWIWSCKPKSSPNDKLEDNPQEFTNGHEAAPLTPSPITQADALSSGAEEKLSTPPNTIETSMYFELPPDQRFNIQFGRTVMSSLLKLEDRADWRSVPSEGGDEARDALAWKEDLGEFDFAMT